MALITYHSADSRLEDLHRQFAALDRELCIIQKCYSKLKQEHGRKCSKALTDAISSLTQVVNYVNKSDKSLVYWYERGSNMKLALRCVGIDKRTSTMVEKKTTKIAGKAAMVETQFNRSGEIFSDGLKAAQNLNTRVTHYSLSSIGDARHQAVKMYDEIDGNAQSVEISLRKSQTDCVTIQKEIDDIPGQISVVKSSRSTAQKYSNSSSDVQTDPVHKK